LDHLRLYVQVFTTFVLCPIHSLITKHSILKPIYGLIACDFQLFLFGSIEEALNIFSFKLQHMISIFFLFELLILLPDEHSLLLLLNEPEIHLHLEIVGYLAAPLATLIVTVL